MNDPAPRAGPPSGPQPGLLEALGPGLVTGAADDDPSGIATYTIAGAQFGIVLHVLRQLGEPFLNLAH